MTFETSIWLFPLAITIHNIEEALWLPQWSRGAGRFHHPVGAFEFRFAVAVLTALAWIVTGLAATGGRGSGGVYLLCSYCFAMLINVFIPHFAAAIALKRYAPGLATALVINLPVTAWLLVQALRQGYIQWGPFLLRAAVFTALLIGLIPLLFKTGRALEQRFPGSEPRSR